MILDLPPAIEAHVVADGGYVFRDESILGTRLHIALVAESYAAALAAAQLARAEIDRLDWILDSRKACSELSILNRSREHRASSDLFAVVYAAEEWRSKTYGAYSGRLGRLLRSWELASDEPPARDELARLARDADLSHVVLDASTRTIVRPDAVEFALDALAKGWIVDRAYAAARSAVGVFGALIDIGGDVRCGGRAPAPEGWRIGVADPHLPVDNAPCIATAHLRDAAIATSGRGPRDRLLRGVRYSATLSGIDGWPVTHAVSASVIAASAADADALATVALVLPEERARELVDAHGAAARIASSDGTVAWTRLAQADTAPAHFVGAPTREPVANDALPGWRDGWQALATFTAPRRQLIRDPDFRSPYMAMWITGPDNQLVRTLILVGKRPDWQKDNFIWWSMNRANTERLVATRSMSTSGAGVYNVFWDGVDDRGEAVPAGTYVLHVETSRERGKHTYRSLTLDFSKAERFVSELAPTEEGGGLRVSFDHY